MMSLSFDDGFDRAKSEWTRETRGIDFVEARAVFGDPNETIAPGIMKDGEERWLRVGLVRGRLWTVGYTIRNGLIRIFMARPARRDEQEAYNG